MYGCLEGKEGVVELLVLNQRIAEVVESESVAGSETTRDAIFGRGPGVLLLLVQRRGQEIVGDVALRFARDGCLTGLDRCIVVAVRIMDAPAHNVQSEVGRLHL